jgi:hypothetical protein
LFFAFIAGPAHFEGQPSLNSHVSVGWRDGAALAQRLAVHHGLAPGPEILAVGRVAALQADIGVLALAGNLANGDVFAAFSILDDVGLGREAAHFGEACSHVLDCDDEVERRQRIVA